MPDRGKIQDEYREHLPSYLLLIHPGGQAIYIALILLLLLLLASLPLVSVQISVSGHGIIRPLSEKTRLISSASGVIEKVFVNEGERILKSEPLLQIRSEEPRENLNLLREELYETELHAGDLLRLTASPIQIPVSPKFKGEYSEYIDRLEYLDLLRNRAERELERQEGLYRGGLISMKEYDDLVFTAEKARKELENYQSHTYSQWQHAYYMETDKMRDLKSRIRQTEERILLSTIPAPVTGNLVEFQGIMEGTAIQAGSIIGVLSPDSGLIGEFYISPADIAFLKTGQKVHLHLDAFPAREWGVLNGLVYDISNDFLLMNNHPVYRVKCRLDHTKMYLKSGYAGSIMKGMTFQARCLVARRSLWQLLGDKAENWLNPVLTGNL